ncbi:MAG: hypothetical protein AAF363_06865 [Bacteroidota bacterium]
MKIIKVLIFSISIAGLLMFSACSDDEEVGPGTGNISVTISGLTGIDADVQISGPNSFSQTLTATTNLTELELGSYTIIANNVNNDGQLFAVDPDDTEVSFTLAQDATESVIFEYQAADEVIGIQGEWYSAGDNVAPLLFTLFMTDSIYAEFRSDNTYTVEQFDVSGGQLTFTGVYTQTPSSVNDIYDIVLDQSTPSALTAEGIFQITSEVPDAMQYEVAQTSPDIGAIPPTAEGGFGSTSGGVLGTTNVQNFVRLSN